MNATLSIPWAEAKDYDRAVLSSLIGATAASAPFVFLQGAGPVWTSVTFAFLGAILAAGLRDRWELLAPIAFAGGGVGAFWYTQGIELLLGGLVLPTISAVAWTFLRPSPPVSARPWTALIFGFIWNHLALLPLGVLVFMAGVAGAPFLSILAGVIVGLSAASGLAVAHLGGRRDPVERMARTTRAQGEIGALSRRALEAYRAALKVLTQSAIPAEQSEAVRARLQEVGQRVLGLAGQWEQVEQNMREGDRDSLTADLTLIQRRIDATEDPGAKKQYGLAVKAILEQLQQYEQLDTGRERVIATLHGQVAQLERTRTALVGLSSSGSHRLAAELQGLTDLLGDAADAMEAESEAVLELGAGLR